MLSFIKTQLSSVYAQLTSKLGQLFSAASVDTTTLKELERILIEADTGTKTTRMLCDQLKKDHGQGLIKTGADVRTMLKKQLLEILAQPQPMSNNARAFLFVGINGSGKTTSIAKLAHLYAQQGKKVLLVAADTFRAAAVEQLSVWAQRTNTALVTGTQGQDPASVVFMGCERFKREHFDIMLIDTAGRLQTKTNLMRELEKIKKILVKQLPDTALATMLTIDAMLGQNSREQAQLFHDSTHLDGIVLTKMDGTGKGGIVLSIAHEFTIPIAYISHGEALEQLKQFDAQEFVDGILE